MVQVFQVKWNHTGSQLVFAGKLQKDVSVVQFYNACGEVSLTYTLIEITYIHTISHAHTHTHAASPHPEGARQVSSLSGLGRKRPPSSTRYSAVHLFRQHQTQLQGGPTYVYIYQPFPLYNVSYTHTWMHARAHTHTHTHSGDISRTRWCTPSESLKNPTTVSSSGTPLVERNTQRQSRI